MSSASPSVRRNPWRRLAALLLPVAGFAHAAVVTGPAPAAPGSSVDARVPLRAEARFSASAAQSAAIQRLGESKFDLLAEVDPATGATRRLQDYGGFLTDPDRVTDAAEVARRWVRDNATLLGLDGADLAEAVESSVVRHDRSGTTNLTLQQTWAGLRVFNGLLQVNLEREGRIVSVNNLFLPRLGAALNTTSPSLTAESAIEAAAASIGSDASGLRRVADYRDVEERQRFVAPALSLSPIESRLMILPIRGGEARLVWNFQVETTDTRNWYDFTVDAGDGRVWTRFDWIRDDDYNVYEAPVEAPSFGARSLAEDPADPATSPFGWHDTNGAVGAEFTTTEGNNVHAYTDTNADNVPDAGSSPDGGAGLVFDFPIDLAQAPSTYRPAAVTNLFYWNNHIHDVAYVYGFDEQGANFQVNNYGNGRLGNDSVRAEAQDGSGVNNANFGTPPDGSRPRMQMYLWSSTSPQRDGDLDAGIVAHEYGHGISNRLVGGGNNVGCLQNIQQPGEGLSDWWALFLTQPDATTRIRGIATYSLGQATTGQGLRPDYYDGDPAVNPQPQENVWTYQTIAAGSIPHGVGARWAQAYWQVTWALIDAHGYDADVTNYTGTSADAGNVRAMYYIIQGLKNTICSPRFIDVRDGVLAAASSAYEAEDVCTIWKAFAEFGLGSNAVSASPDSNVVTNGFDEPSACSFLLAVPPEKAVCADDPAQFFVRAGASYTAPVSLVLTNEPAGSTESFTVNPIVTIPGLSTLTVDDLDAVPTGVYPMTLTANGDAANAQTLNLEVQNGVPAAATLSAPANGATEVALRPTFQWSPVLGADTYVLEIDDDPDMLSPFHTSAALGTESYQPANNLPGLAQLYWRVTSSNLCGTGGTSGTFTFTTQLAPEQCAPGTTEAVTHLQDWESGLGGWTTSGTLNSWALVGDVFHSGTTAMHADDPEQTSDQRLLSPAMVVPALAPQLVFWTQQDMETNAPNGCFDGGILEVSTDGGTTFTQVPDSALLSDPYDGPIFDQPSNPLAGLPAWCGNPQPMLVSVVDMSAWAGQSVRLRFRLGSDGGVGASGWWLDDIYMSSCQPADYIFVDGFESNGTSQWSSTNP